MTAEILKNEIGSANSDLKIAKEDHGLSIVLIDEVGLSYPISDALGSYRYNDRFYNLSFKGLAVLAKESAKLMP